MSKKSVLLLSLVSFFLFAQPALARSGCCSHHGGVMSNGCGCNDGTPLSSTCAPYYACTAGSTETAPIQTSIPTSTPYVIPSTRPTKIPVKTFIKLPTNTPTPTITDTPTPTPIITTAPTIKVETHIQTPKHTGFWGLLFSLFGINKR